MTLAKIKSPKLSPTNAPTGIVLALVELVVGCFEQLLAIVTQLLIKVTNEFF